MNHSSGIYIYDNLAKRLKKLPETARKYSCQTRPIFLSCRKKKCLPASTGGNRNENANQNEIGLRQVSDSSTESGRKEDESKSKLAKGMCNRIFNIDKTWHLNYGNKRSQDLCEPTNKKRGNWPIIWGTATCRLVRDYWYSARKKMFPPPFHLPKLTAIFLFNSPLLRGLLILLIDQNKIPIQQ